MTISNKYTYLHMSIKLNERHRVISLMSFSMVRSLSLFFKYYIKDLQEVRVSNYYTISSIRKFHILVCHCNTCITKCPHIPII